MGAGGMRAPGALMPDRPIVVDLYCGLGGWSEGFLAEGFRCIGIDIERHEYGEHRYPGQLVIQDARTLHGSQFRSAACIVASPPCQEYSYMAMPWSRAKQIQRALMRKDDFPEGYAGSRTIVQLNELFDTCFRIQREACEAAGRHIPMVVENVRGAQPWVGRAQGRYGSFFLWGGCAGADADTWWAEERVRRDVVPQQGAGNSESEPEPHGHKPRRERRQGPRPGLERQIEARAGVQWACGQEP